MTYEEIRGRLSRKRVGIAGCGGLGSNCAIALARVGMGTLVIVDFDCLSVSNLNRQYYFRDQVGMKKVEALADNILRIDPTIRVEKHAVRITATNFTGLFAGCDVIVEAFDLAEEKEMLITSALTHFPTIPLVVGSGMAGWGNNAAIHCRRLGNIYVCGDETSEISASMPPLAPRVGMVANMQANVVMDILLNSVQL